MELTTVWFILIAVLWVGYFVLEGFDFGVGMLLPFLPRGEQERRLVINTIGPVWDGNEVWLLVAGGATFAAFPEWYATLFSGFYLPLLLILLALIVRAVAFEYRHKRHEQHWRNRWDAAIFIGSAVPALLWGVAFANIVRGVEIDADKEYVGTFWDLLNPFALLGGVTTVMLFLTHGALFIALKTDGDIRHRARSLALKVGVAAAVVAVAFLIWAQSLRGSGGSLVLFALAALALLGGLFAAYRGREGWGFIGNFSAIALAVAGLFVALFPDVMPTTLDGGVSLTTTNAAATHYTLQIMTVVAVVFTPLVLLYQAWTYWVFRRRISTHHIPVAPANDDRSRRLSAFDRTTLELLRPAQRDLVAVVALTVAQGVVVVAQAFAITGLVVALVDGGALAGWAWTVAGVFAVRALISWCVDVAAARSAAVVGTSLRGRLLARAAHLDARWWGTRSTGSITVLATRGVAATEPYLTRFLPAILVATTLPVLTVLAMGSQDLLSAAIVLFTLPLVPVFAALVGWNTQQRAQRQWREMSTLAGHFVDVVKGLPTLVAFRRAAVQTGRIREVSDRHRRATLDTLRLAFASSAVLELLATISVALVAVAVGLRLRSGDLDLQTALVVLLLAPEAYWPLRRMGAEFHAAAEGGAALREVAEVLAQPEREAGWAVPDLTHQPITLAGVTVTYPGRTHRALEPVDAVIRPRTVVAIAGPSGAGKSTLLQMLRGDLVGEGSIEVGERCLADIDADAWAARVAWIPQQPWVAAGSLADNVRLARPDADDDEVWAALSQVGLGHVASASVEGIDRVLGEDGRGLSAGERARLALARAVISQRPLILLDEPTAHLDAATEEVVLATIEWLARRATVVVVAHRTAILDLADTVITLSGPPPREALPSDAGEQLSLTGHVQPTSATDEEVDSAPSTDSGNGRLIWGIAVGCLATAAGAALTATAGWLIVRASEHPPVLTLLVAIVAVRTFGIARPMLRYVERLVSHDAALRDLGVVRASVFAALIPITPGALGPRRGDVLASVVDDVDAHVDRRLRVWAPVATGVSVGLAAAVLVGIWSPRAGLSIAAITLVGMAGFGLTYATGNRLERSFVTERSALSDEVAGFVEGRGDLVAWQADQAALDRLVARSRTSGKILTRSATAAASLRALVLTSVGLGVVGCSLAVRSPVEGGAMSPSAAALIVLVPLGLAEALLALPDAGTVAARVRAAIGRLDALTRLAPVVSSPVAPSGSPAPAREVRVEHVTAGWDRRDVLVDVQLDLPAGSRVGIVGPSGSGKSTLAALLMRFIDPRDGRITFDGVDAREVALDDVRAAVGLVDDDPHVFASSVVENVRLASPSATDQEVDVALRRARLGPWLDGLPDGLHTRVGDGGSDVSGGERARLAIARSVLADQPVLVLDEPTAHLDTTTAYEVLADALDASAGRTVVLITHRADALDHVDGVLDLGGDGRSGSLESSHGVRDQ